MKEIKKKEKILKESSNPINKQNILNKDNNHNHSSVDSIKGFKEKTQISLYINRHPKEKEEKKTIYNSNSEISLTAKNLENIIKINKAELLSNKKERYKLEQKMKYDSNQNYKEKDIDKNNLKKNNFQNNDDEINNQNINKNKIAIVMNNQVNINKNIILKKLIKIQIILLFLVSLSTILYLILNKNNKSKKLILYISSLSLSIILLFFTLFLIILIILGIFQHYYTSSIFRFLCIINFCISISLIIIQIISILKFNSAIIEKEKKIKKIFVYFLIFIITGIIILVNLHIGTIAKESLLILIGYKNENACPERKVKKGGNRLGGNYVYFNEESEGNNDVNLNALKKFHACIYSNN